MCDSSLSLKLLTLQAVIPAYSNFLVFKCKTNHFSRKYKGTYKKRTDQLKNIEKNTCTYQKESLSLLPIKRQKL